MALVDILIVIFILYILYKLVFDFIVPVTKTASQFKSQVDQVKRMQEQMRQQQAKQENTAAPSPKPKPSNKKDTTTTDGEYIDFEDVK